MTAAEKRGFILHTTAQLLEGLSEEMVPRWGKMNAIQMLEHLTTFFDVSANKITMQVVTQEDQLPLYRAFLLSEKPFRENTKAPETIIPETPLPITSKNWEEALINVQRSIQEFEDFFTANPDTTTSHPVFGPLTYGEWIQLHHKHLCHHLKQFALID